MHAVEFESYGGKPVKIFVHDRPDTVSEHIEAHRFWFERQVLEHIATKHPIQGTIVDVGANIGNHTLFFATHTTCRRIVAFEPHPDNMEVLRANVSLVQPGLEVHAIACALGSSDGECGLHMNYDTNLGMVRVVEGVGTEMRRLDSYGFDDVSLIKIDVEGMEPHVLSGAVHTIRRWRPTIVLEATSVQALHQSMSVLAPLGYVCFTAIDDENPTFEFRHLRIG